MTVTRKALRIVTTARMGAVMAGLLAGWLGWYWLGSSRQPVLLEVRSRVPAIESGHRVRVNLTSQPARELQVQVQGEFEVRPVGSPRVLFRSSQNKPIRVRANSRGIQWGSRVIAVGRIVIHPAKSPAIWVNDHLYRGDVTVYRRPGGRVMAVNVIDLEQYIASVVDSEMPLTFPAAARRAQAIVARSYVLYQQQLAGARREFDVYASTRSQKYQGYQYRDGRGRKLAGESDSSRQVVQETAGQVALFNGQLFPAYYSAVCGGRTTNGPAVFSDAVAALTSVPCQWCQAAERFRWTRTMSADRATVLLKKHFAKNGQAFQQLKSITTIPDSRDEAAGGSRIQVSDGSHTYIIDGRKLRSLFSGSVLPSPYFNARLDGGQVIFDGRGHGHGVGLCQWGARGQALAGRSTTQIIQAYYPGVSLVTVDLHH